MMTTAFSHNIRSICNKLPQLVIGGLKEPICVRKLSSLPSGSRITQVSSRLERPPAISRDLISPLTCRKPLSLSPKELNSSLEYALPTTCINATIQKGTTVQSNVFDCPTLTTSQPFSMPGSYQSILEPDTGKEILAPERQNVEKMAKNCLKIRRRKMNRHHLKKLRKRMKFVFRKRLHRKKKMKEAKLQEEFRVILKRAEDFDPKEFVQKNIELARKGGYHVNIFESLKQERR